MIAKPLRQRAFALLTTIAAAATSCKAGSGALVKVTNGIDTADFPYVVGITMDGKTFCTGTFVSDAVLITAAHCVDRAGEVTYDGKSVARADIFLAPDWPRQGPHCSPEVKSEFDLAVVRFPPGTFTGSEVAHLATREPGVGEDLTIVGYGNDQIVPYERFCTVAEAPGDDGLCHLALGIVKSGARFDFTPVFSWKPRPKAAGPTCPAACDTQDLAGAWSEAGSGDLPAFIGARCGGKLDSRGYAETGLGTRRLGRNRATQVDGGVIELAGGLGGKSDGLDASTGRGDSGGPLFLTENDGPVLAGATSGGNLVLVHDTVRKAAKYVSLLAPHNRGWLLRLAKEQSLNITGLAPAP